MKNVSIHLFHILFISGLLFYVAIIRGSVHPWTFPFLVALGIFVFGYHAYKCFLKKGNWVHYVHLILVSPLVVYIGLSKTQTPPAAYELLLLLAFATLGHHLYYLLK